MDIIHSLPIIVFIIFPSISFDVQSTKKDILLSPSYKVHRLLTMDVFYNTGKFKLLVSFLFLKSGDVTFFLYRLCTRPVDIANIEVTGDTLGPPKMYSVRPSTEIASLITIRHSLLLIDLCLSCRSRGAAQQPD